MTNFIIHKNQTMKKESISGSYFFLGMMFINLLFFSCAKEQETKTDSIIESEASEIGLKSLLPKLLVGSPINATSLQDTNYSKIAKKEFSAGQSLWYARWDGWTSESTFNFTNLNASINWCVQNNKSTHVHMLLGPNFYMPDWLLNGSWTNVQLNQLLKKEIFSAMESNDNKNKVDVWNIINELFNDDGTYRDDVIWNQLGWEVDLSNLTGDENVNTMHPVFIRKAFNFARSKTTKKLEYRDYLIENNNPIYGFDKKHKAVYQLLKHMLNSGIPIDAVGLQGHYDIGNLNWILENNELKNNIEKFKDLGLEVYMTELDLGSGLNPWNSELAQQQKQDYYNVVSQTIAGGASRIYTWGFQDGLDAGWRTNEHPLPWDENLIKKPAYFGIRKAIIDAN